MSRHVINVTGWSPYKDRLKVVRKDLDQNDFRLLSVTKALLPELVDLRTIPNMPAVYDQGNLGSCTANSVGFLHHYLQVKNNNTIKFAPSRLFIYYNTRKLQGTISYDSGASLGNSIRAINLYGVCKELQWPYNTIKYRVAPIPAMYAQGRLLRATAYKQLNGITEMKQSLADGFPFTIGFLVYSSFYNIGSDGRMPYPQPSERILGGHAVVAVGYDDNKQTIEGGTGMFIVRNSWGPRWGDGGHFYMSYQFILNNYFADEFFTVTKITNPTKVK